MLRKEYKGSERAIKIQSSVYVKKFRKRVENLLLVILNLSNCLTKQLRILIFLPPGKY